MLRDLIFLLDSSFLGFRPLHDERWLAVSDLSTSIPISAINDVAERSFIPGMVLQPFQRFRKLLLANLKHPGLALFLVLLCQVHLFTQPFYHVYPVRADYTFERGRNDVSAVVADDAPMYELHQLFRVGNSFWKTFHHGLVAFAANIGHVIAQTYVAVLQHGIRFGKLPHNLLIEVKDATVVLTQLLYSFESIGRPSRRSYGREAV